MKVGAIQSSYIPWRGYFDFIASVDMFVFYDDVQYSKGSWRNRNRIKTPNGTEWITVPVLHKNLLQTISETKIKNDSPWSLKHSQQIHANYCRAPFFKETIDIFSGINTEGFITISELNIELTKKICTYLEISTPMLNSSELSLSGCKTDRLIDLLNNLEATTYLSGPSADIYLDKNAFRENNIQLEYKSYDYEPYPQLWGPFEGAVTVLDLIANCGPESKNLIRSKTPNKIVVE